MFLSFSDCLSACSESELPKNSEPLTGLDYPAELALKRKAFQLFCRSNLRGIPAPEPLIPAVQPRHYRGNSKRKGQFRNGRFSLRNLDSTPAGTASPLEPESHAKLFELICTEFSRKSLHVLASHTNFCIIRGAGAFQALVLNVNQFDARVIHAAKSFAEILKKQSPQTVSFFLYLDETESGYYLEQKRPEGRMGIKKLFGPEHCSVKLDNLKLMYPPTVFSQVNEAMLPLFARTAKELLEPQPQDSLLDLYCGYGLLGLSMADSVGNLTGVEIDGPAVKAASGNAAYLFRQKKIRFVKGEISPVLLRTKLPAEDSAKRELMILDPPRSGTAGGVIRELAKRHPEKVLHIVCGTDRLPEEIAEWRKYGYQLKKLLPLDLFPGTASLETFLLFLPENAEK